MHSSPTRSETYVPTLSLPDALPIVGRPRSRRRQSPLTLPAPECRKLPLVVDRRRAAAGCRAGSRLQRRLLSALRFWQAVAPAGPLVSTLLQIRVHRSEEHTSERQSLMRISYAVF